MGKYQQTRWTDGDIAILKRLYPDTRTADVARQLGLPVSRVYSKARKIGLKKSDAYLSSSEACRLRVGNGVGAETQFKPGHKTWNKGMKGLNLGGAETQFKPGNRSGEAVKRYKPIGTERLSKDGYLQRKVNDDMTFHKRWRCVHILIWEEANGPLPDGHAVVFKDGNKQHLALDNLELVTRVELMRRNSYHMNYPKEVAKLVQLCGAITRHINKRSKT